MKETLFKKKKNMLKVLVLIIITLLAPRFTAVSQVCDSLILKETDKFTDKVSYRIKSELIKMDGQYIRLFVSISKTESGAPIFFLMVKERGFGCTDEGNDIYFLFTDGTKATFKNNADFSCDGSSSIYLDKYHKQNKELKDMLMAKTLSALKINSRTSSYQTDIDLEDAEKFRLGAKCLFELK